MNWNMYTKNGHLKNGDLHTEECPQDNGLQASPGSSLKSTTLFPSLR